jgi:hypothetical protein
LTISSCSPAGAILHGVHMGFEPITGTDPGMGPPVPPPTSKHTGAIHTVHAEDKQRACCNHLSSKQQKIIRVLKYILASWKRVEDEDARSSACSHGQRRLHRIQSGPPAAALLLKCILMVISIASSCPHAGCRAWQSTTARSTANTKHDICKHLRPAAVKARSSSRSAQVGRSRSANDHFNGRIAGNVRQHSAPVSVARLIGSCVVIGFNWDSQSRLAQRTAEIGRRATEARHLSTTGTQIHSTQILRCCTHAL